MDHEVKALIRQEQAEAFAYFYHLCKLQHNAARKFLMEQPRSSELLHIPTCEALNTELGGSDEILCMCAHGLTDPDNGLPCMKPTTLRGNVKLRRVVRWCNCTKQHQILQGRAKGGALRTAGAQSYTKLFCLRLAADIADDLKSNKKGNSYFPAEDGGYTPNSSLRVRDRDLAEQSDEERLQARDDPYQTAPDGDLERNADKLELELKDIRSKNTAAEKPRLMPTAKPLGRPNRTDVSQPASPAIVVVKPNRIETHEPGQAASSNSVAIPQEVITIDDLPVDSAVASSELQLAKTKPVLEDYNSSLMMLSKQAGLQLPNGGYRTFQSGAKVNILQELFGTPSGKTIKLAILTKKAGALAVPEPLCSRAFLTHFMHLSQDTAEASWTNHGWK